jgi:hypothetical protein
MVWAMAAPWLCTSYGLGCGARSTVDSMEQTANASGAGGTSSGSRGGSGGQAPVAPVDTSALPECELGFPRFETDQGCQYTYESLCYDTPQAACACACPRGGESSCVIGGFLNPDEPQSVSCFRR